MKRALFLDRDGTLIEEPPVTFQVDTLEQMTFLRGVFRNLYFIRKNTDLELVIVSNQDGLGTASHPQENFDLVQRKMLEAFRGEGIVFDDILIDEHFPEDNHPNRKPGTGMLGKYMTGEYDLANSYVVGDRLTDMRLATNLGCRGLLLTAASVGAQNGSAGNAAVEISASIARDYPNCRAVSGWDQVAELIFAGERTAEIRRTTKETDILVSLNIDGDGRCEVSTGLGFFDHMLEQIGRHSGFDLTIKVKGDLHVDEHHTIEDTALALGECLRRALGDKRGIERYGFCLPMDDCLCQVALDFGGRPWLVYDAEFKREKIGEMPTEMFLHFFKSLSDAALMNLNIKAEGQNEHHKIEGVFKALAKSLKMAARRDIYAYRLPSTKGVL